MLWRGATTFHYLTSVFHEENERATITLLTGTLHQMTASKKGGTQLLDFYQLLIHRLLYHFWDSVCVIYWKVYWNFFMKCCKLFICLLDVCCFSKDIIQLRVFFNSFFPHQQIVCPLGLLLWDSSYSWKRKEKLLFFSSCTMNNFSVTYFNVPSIGNGHPSELWSVKPVK